MSPNVITLYLSTHTNYRTAATTNTLGASLVLGIKLHIPCTKVMVNNNNNNNNSYSKYAKYKN
jgi:hypothetical protein